MWKESGIMRVKYGRAKRVKPLCSHYNNDTSQVPILKALYDTRNKLQNTLRRCKMSKSLKDAALTLQINWFWLAVAHNLPRWFNWQHHSSTTNYGRRNSLTIARRNQYHLFIRHPDDLIRPLITSCSHLPYINPPSLIPSRPLLLFHTSGCIPACAWNIIRLMLMHYITMDLFYLYDASPSLYLSLWDPDDVPCGHSCVRSYRILYALVL